MNFLNAKISISALIASIAILPFSASALSRQWTPDEARAWSAKSGWKVGANYIPADAINPLEMWQAETFNPTLIDRELGYAEGLGFNSVRVFLHDLPWDQDSVGFGKRIDLFLKIASAHKIRPVFVLFDSCWNPNPQLGVQPLPRPGVHNSGWIQSPGIPALSDPKQIPRLRRYVEGVIKKFAADPRILAWDLWNEPDNLNVGSANDTAAKVKIVEGLLPKVFAWARTADATQPLTSAVWNGDWSHANSLKKTETTQLNLSDIISFHNYDPAFEFSARVDQLRRYDRPLFLTEYMARPRGSTVEAILPVAKKENVSAYVWGFVSGKTQTIYPWDSWEHPYPSEPILWFHDLLRQDGSPFSNSELLKIRELTGKK